MKKVDMVFSCLLLVYQFRFQPPAYFLLLYNVFIRLPFTGQVEDASYYEGCEPCDGITEPEAGVTHPEGETQEKSQTYTDNDCVQYGYGEIHSEVTGSV
jgi:hypothetical protein